MPKPKKLSWLPVYKAAFQNVRLNFWPLIFLEILYFLVLFLIVAAPMLWVFKDLLHYLKSAESFTFSNLLPQLFNIRNFLLATIWLILTTALTAVLDGGLYRTLLDGTRKLGFSLKSFFSAGRRFFLPNISLNMLSLPLYLILYMPFYFWIGKEFIASENFWPTLFVSVYSVFSYTLIQTPLFLMKTGIVEGKTLKRSWSAMKKKIKLRRGWVLKGMVVAFTVFTAVTFVIDQLMPDFTGQNSDDIGTLLLMTGLSVILVLLNALVASVIYCLYFPALAVQFWISKEVKRG